MKILVLLLLFVSTANLVLCTERKFAEVLLQPGVLRPDLEELQQYFKALNKDGEAFVQWPNNITFLVHYDSKIKYLKVEGTFTITPSRVDYDGLYFVAGGFYLATTYVPGPIGDDMPLYYSPSSLPERQHYASIKYFGLDEIKGIIEPFHSKYSFDYGSEVPPASFLAIADKPEHFIEYTLWSENWLSRPVDGSLRVLLAAEAPPEQLVLLKNVEAQSLIFNQSIGKIVVSTEANRFGPQGPEQLKNVFGIRMARVAVVADVENETVNWFNSGDWSGKTKHFVRAIDFVRKIQNVEPRHTSGDYDARPRHTYFHIMGHVLQKRVNDQNGEIDKDCPLVIEYKTKGLKFFVGMKKLGKLCTDDSKLWEINDKGKKVFEPREVIHLTHPYYGF